MDTHEYGANLSLPVVRPPVPLQHKVTQPLARFCAYSAFLSNLVVFGISVVGFRVGRRGSARWAVSLGGSCPQPLGDAGQRE